MAIIALNECHQMRLGGRATKPAHSQQADTGEREDKAEQRMVTASIENKSCI